MVNRLSIYSIYKWLTETITAKWFRDPFDDDLVLSFDCILTLTAFL